MKRDRAKSCEDGGEAGGPTPANLARDLGDQNSLLIRETRHRVANGLQMVAGMLLLDARASGTEEARDRLLEAYHRVMAVAALERQLSSSQEGLVALRPYLATLVDHIIASVIATPHKIALEVIADDGMVAPDTARFLGLIATELVINAIKHAFPDGGPGNIEVSWAARDGGWVLNVHDDGAGTNGGARRAAAGIGTNVVQALVRQMGAQVSVEPSGGGRSVSVVFPAPDAA